jgi:hypothetical protein
LVPAVVAVVVFVAALVVVVVVAALVVFVAALVVVVLVVGFGLVLLQKLTKTRFGMLVVVMVVMVVP